MSRLHTLKYYFLSIALICPALLRAQASTTPTVTTINLNNTVLQSPVKRLGINLGAANFYDSGQILKNLIVSNPGFEGEIAQTMVLCSAGTQGSCTDSISYSGWPADYWDGATYTFVYGTAIGRTGTISTSTSGNGQAAVFNFADTSGGAPSAGDYMIVKKPNPPNFCNGGPSSCVPSAVEGWQYTLGGNGTVDTNTTDLPPGTQGTQSLVMNAPNGGDSATITYYFDSYSGHTFLQLNGTYTLSFKAKTTIPGGSTMYVSLQRLSSNVANAYVNDTMVPLTNQWKTFTYTFTANETGNAVGSVRLIFGTAIAGQTQSANQVYLDDTSLVKQNTDPTNTTVFRDEVVNTLKQLNPGVVRFWFNQEAETLDNLLAPQLARQRSQYQYVDVNYISYGLTEFLQLLQTVSSGANATSTPPEPWIVIPITLSNTEASNLIDYLAGDATTAYGAKRIAAGQTMPWTQVFPKIHLEFSNEAWNSGLYGGNMANGQAYGTRAQSVFASMKSNQNYNAASFDLIINGQATQIGNEAFIQQYCNNNDTFASQPYMMLTVNDPAASGLTGAAAIENLFGSTFAEAEAFVTASGTAEGTNNGFVLQNIGVAQNSGKQYAVTETNLDPFNGGSITQAEADSYTTSIGGGLALIDSMLQNMRVGVLTQNIFSLTGYQYFPYNHPSLYLYGTVVDMGVTNLQRPQFQAEEMANNAIGANTNMLQTVHTGLDPTWNQPYANSVQLNNAHYLQSFAYNSGNNYSLIIINTNRSASEQVNFAGANVPGGTVQMTQLTSANITDTNENSATFAPVTSTLTNFNAAAGMSLPPFSMTTLTWTASAISNVTFSNVTGTSATISWTVSDPTATSVVNYGTTTAYGSQSAASGSGGTQSVTLTGLTAGTEYNFSIVSTSGSGAISTSANYTFGTTASFTLSAPSSISVAPGTTGTVPVQVSDTNGYTGSVTLSVSGLPTGVTGTFQTSSGNASLILTVPSTVLGGTYELTITGTAGGTSQLALVSLVISGASQSQTITFTTIPNQYIGATVTAVATSSVGLTPVTFSVVPNGNCSSSGTNGSTIKFLAAGNCGIIASQAGNATYGPASVGQIVVINSALPTQTINFTSSNADEIVGSTLALTATSVNSSGTATGLTVSFSSTTPGTCTVSGTTATFIAIGTCTINASQGGNSQYAAAPTVPLSINVKGQPQTITFANIPTQNASTTLTLTAVASSNLPITYSSTTQSVCTVSGTTLTFTATGGNCTITASQTGNTQYAAAMPVSQTFMVNPPPVQQVITFGTIAAQNVGTPLTLSATSNNATIAITYAASPSTVCMVSGSTVSFIATGTCTITASQAAGTGYLAATPVSQSFTVNAALKAQTITWNTIAAQYVGTPLTLTATASSNLTVSFASNSTSICTVSGTTAQFIAGGTCSITASQAGGNGYAAATPVTQTFTVNTTNYPQTINFPTIPTQTAGTTLTLSATSVNSGGTATGLAVSFASTTTSVCTVSGTTATFVAAGTCSITASQAGGGQYAAATPVSQSFTVQSGTTTPTTTTVSLGSAATLYGIFNNGSAVTNGGLDTSNYAYSANLLGTGLTFQGIPYVFGTAGSANAATSTTIALPAGSYASLNFLGTAIYGNQAAQTFTVTYTDGTTSTFTQSMSDWGSPQNYTGETVAAAMAYRLTPSGAQSTGQTFNLYAYSFALNNTKTVKSFTLPNVRNVTVLAVTLSPTQTALTPQTITFNALPSQIVGGTLTVSATASSGLPVTFTVVPNGNCSISGNVVTFLNVGNCGVVANQAGNATYAAAPAVGQIVVVNNPTPQSITFGTIAAQTVGTPLTLSATASSGLGVSYASSTANICTVSGSTATFLAAGTCSITASQPGNNVYSAAAPVSQSFTVNAGSLTAQTITFGTIATQTVGTPLTLSATASSNLAVTFASSTAGVCTVSGTTATFVASGTCTITASQAGNSTYAPATASQTFTVNGQPQTITFGTIAAQTVGTPLTLSASASSGAAVSFASSTTSVCTVSGTTATFVASGTCTITASQAGTSTYAAAPTVSQSFTVNAAALKSQTITFNTIPAQTVGTPLTLSATAGSGAAVTFASSTTGVCTVSGNTATFVASGTCTITASQAGTSTYAAAPNVSQSFTVNGEPQTITFNAIPSQVVGGTLTVSATASSNLPITYVIVPNGNCSISGAVVTFLNVGNCGVIATQPGNSVYAAAAAVGQVIVVNQAPTLTAQTITFGTIATQTVGTPLTLTATASSGLAVSYASSTTSICTVSGSTATFVAAGTCTITASQAGNSTYAAATSVSQSFTVKAAPATVSLTSAANVYGIFANGKSVTNGGLDNYSYAYSSTLLPTSLTVGGIPFTLGTVGAADAVANAKVTLPSGSYSTLYFLGTGVDGNQTGQQFTVTYTDGTTTVATQSLSDWGAPQSYSGESTASTMAYRVTPSGGTQSQNWYLYKYSITLNSAKTVQSITLPASRYVVVLAMTLAH
jgi:hypothetical protein